MTSSTTETTVTVGTALTTLLEQVVRDEQRMGFFLENTGAAALNGFEIQGKLGPNQNFWQTLFTSTGTPSGILIAASGEMNTLAAGAKGVAIIEVGGIAIIRLQGKVAAGTTTVKCGATAD